MVFVHHSTGVPGLSWAIEVREFPAGQSHVGGTEGHRLTRQKKKNRLETGNFAKIQVFRVYSFFLFIPHGFFFHPIFRSEDH